MDTVRSLLEPVDAREWSRRAVVLSLATGLSGCAGLVGSPDPPVDSPTASGTPTETVAETDTPTETATPAQDVELDAEDLRIVWKPSLDEVDSPEAFPERHRPSVTAQAGNDATELEELNAFLEGEDGGRQEVGLSEGENTLSPRTVSDGENTLKVVNPGTGGTVARTSVTGEKPDVYPIDFRDADAATQGTPPTQMQSIGAWDTAYSFDTHAFSHDRIWGKRQDWNKDASYSGLVEMIKQGPEKASEVLDGDDYYVIFPEYEDSYGHWDKEKFRSSSDAAEVLTWANAAVQAQQNRILRDDSRDRVDTSKLSAYNNANAATTERIVNEVYDPESEEDLVRTTFINEGGHGTVLAHVDTENTGIFSEADTDWFFVETTGNWVDPITAERVSGDRGDYNPVLDGYSGEARSQSVTYDRVKDRTDGSLVSFVQRYDGSKHTSFDRISFSDDVHEFVWDKWINRENGSPEPIVDMVERAADFHLENDDGYVQVFTAEDEEVQYNEEEEVFENVYMAAGDEDLYNMSMDPEMSLTQKDVEGYMEEVTAA